MKIKQRNKKSILTIEGKFPSPYENIKLKISAFPDDWYNLIYEFFGKPKHIEKPIFDYLKTVFDQVLNHILAERPRGVHSSMWEFTHKLKVRTAYIFCLLEYWLKKPEENWPESIKNAVKETPKIVGQHRKGIRKPKIHEITVYIIERDFGKEREKNNPKSNPWTDDPENFRKTYISKNPFIQTYKPKEKDFEKAKIDLPPDLPITLKHLSKGSSELILTLK